MTPPRKGQRAAIYARISDARDGDTAGVDRQVEDCQELAKRDGLEVVAVYAADIAPERLALWGQRLQRDEFLPLRVIRQELASGKVAVERSGGRENRTRRARLLMASSERLDLVGLAEETGAEPELLRELIDYGLVGKPPSPDTEIYDETDVAVVNAAGELVKAGIGPRNLKTFRTSADRESQLVEALLAPKLVSRNPQRRKEAVESLERIATSMGELKQSLLVRDLRRFANS